MVPPSAISRPTALPAPLRGRLCPTYSSVAGLPLASTTYAHALDADWPLCTFEVRGACRDARCQFQMARDYALGAAGVLRSLHALARRCARALHYHYLLHYITACWTVPTTVQGCHEQCCPHRIHVLLICPLF